MLTMTAKPREVHSENSSFRTTQGPGHHTTVLFLANPATKYVRTRGHWGSVRTDVSFGARQGVKGHPNT